MRQQPDAQTAWTRPRALVNMLPASFADGAGRFVGARAVDGGGRTGPAAGALGAVGVSVDDDGGFDAAVGLGGRVLEVGGDEAVLDAPKRLDEGAGGARPTRCSRAARSERSRPPGASGRAPRRRRLFERDVDGTPFERTVGAPAGGPVEVCASAVRRSARRWWDGLGPARPRRGQTGRRRLDPGPARQIHRPDAAGLDAPQTADAVVGRGAEHERRRHVRVAGRRRGRRRRACAGCGARSRVASSATATTASRSSRATPTSSATSVASRLLVDRMAPRVRVVRLAARRVRVIVSDGRRGEASGVRGARIAWGDGRLAQRAQSDARVRGPRAARRERDRARQGRQRAARAQGGGGVMSGRRGARSRCPRAASLALRRRAGRPPAGASAPSRRRSTGAALSRPTAPRRRSTSPATAATSSSRRAPRTSSPTATRPGGRIRQGGSSATTA